MEQTNVLVTGGCGFLGTAIVSALLTTKRFSITAMDINPPSLGSSTFPTQVRYVRADVLDRDALQKVFNEAKPAIVVHTVGVYPLGAARYSTRGKDAVFKVNVEGTRNVIDAAKACGAKGLVYTSSVTVVLDRLMQDFKNIDETWPAGDVDTSYGQSKAIAESLTLTSSHPTFPTIALRSAPIFGPTDPVIIPTIHALIAARSTPFILGNATNLQDYVYIDNIAHAHVLAVQNLLGAQTAAGHAVFVTNGQPVTVRDLCMAVWNEFGHTPRWQVTLPEGLAWGLGYVAEWGSWVAGADLGFSRGMVSDGCRERYVNIAKARRVLGYKPIVSLEEGVRRTCEAYRKKIEGRSKRGGREEIR